MSIALTVVEPFGLYKKGDQITDAKTIKTVLDSESQGSVVKVEIPDASATPA